MKTVLSIQSAVTFGAVGNTMASAVMAATGHQIAQVDTVQLIAHPGHGIRAGGSLADDDFSALIDGMTALNLGQKIDAVMTGYIGKASQIDTLASHLSDISDRKPELDIMVDPAIGDHGRLYVDEAIAEGIEKKLIPIARIITPNAFEFARLTDTESGDPSIIGDAGQRLLDRYSNMKGMAVTGCLFNGTVSDYWIDRDGMISHDAPAEDGSAHQGSNKSGGMAGGGDLFAALMMSLHLSGADWRDAFNKAAELSRNIINDAKKSGAIDIDIAIVNTALKGRD